MLNIKKPMSLVAIVMALQIGSFQSPVCAGEAASTTVLNKIAFGACASQAKPQTIWDAIVTTDPNLFLFIGDNIYGDTEDPSVLKRKYAQLAAKPGYQNLLKTCPLLSTWDDTCL
jgi:alkaline phosphatase D